MNCDVVATSRWAELFSGLPLSSLVAGWFIALLIIGGMARIDTWRKDSITVGFLMSAFGSLYSIILIAVMFGFVKSFCIFCLVIDAVNFSLLGIFWSMKEGPLFSGIDWGKIRNYGILTAVTAFVMVVVLKPVEQKSNSGLEDDIPSLVQSMLGGKVVDIKIPDNALILGNKNATITIIEYSDFQCPYCKRGALIMHSVLNRFRDQVRVVFRPFPLDHACNRMMKNPLHPFSCLLSRAAYCAGEQGKLEAVYEEIFEDQDMLKESSAMNISIALGLDEKKMKACLDSEAAKKYVSDEIEARILVDIQSTPTFYLNGRRVEGALPLEAWEKAIEQLLASGSK